MHNAHKGRRLAPVSYTSVVFVIIIGICEQEQKIVFVEGMIQSVLRWTFPSGKGSADSGATYCTLQLITNKIQLFWFIYF